MVGLIKVEYVNAFGRVRVLTMSGRCILESAVGDDVVVQEAPRSHTMRSSESLWRNDRCVTRLFVGYGAFYSSVTEWCLHKQVGVKGSPKLEVQHRTKTESTNTKPRTKINQPISITNAAAKHKRDSYLRNGRCDQFDDPFDDRYPYLLLSRDRSNLRF